MDKLQFDSFYKFLVSIGAILIITPAFLLHYLISGSYDIVITEEELSSLSSISRELIEHKMLCLNFIYKFLPIFCIVLILAGLILFILGCYKWSTIQQSAIDKLTDLDIREKQLNIEKMSACEIAKKMVVENMEIESETEVNSSIITSLRTSSSANIKKAFEIEDKYYTYISQKYGKNYIYHKNVRIASAEYDIIAESTHSASDMLYEIKYWPNHATIARISSLCKQLEDNGNVYSLNTGRGYRIKIIIVTPDAEIAKLKEHLQHINFEIKYPLLDYELITENSLQK